VPTFVARGRHVVSVGNVRNVRNVYVMAEFYTFAMAVSIFEIS
jgi:hypothetical protein